MRIRKSVAGLGAAALTITGIGVIAAPSASAAAYTTVWQGINNTGLQAPSAVAGTKNVTVTVSPASPNVGDPLTITVTSPDIAFDNGPAATVQTNWSRIDAVVAINGTDYLIKGPSNAGPAATNTNIIQAGWTISSANGGDSATGAGGAANNTNGVATLNSDGTIANASASLTAPAIAGSYPVVLKRLVNNSVSSVLPATGGTGVDAVNDGFDQIWGLNSGVAPYNGATAANNFGTVATLTVNGPSATIATSSGQTAGVQALRAPRMSWAVPTSTMTLTGTTFPASQASGAFTAALCDVTGTTCDTIGVPNSITNTLATDAGGNLTGSIAVTNGGSLALTTGLRAIRITGGGLTVPALVGVRVLGAATVTLTPAQSFLGSAINVSGADFNPGQAVTIYGSIQVAPPFAASTDAPVAAGNANGNGAFSGSFTVSDSATLRVVAYQGNPAGAPGASNPSGLAAWTVLAADDFCDVAEPGDCLTTQTITATVDPGALTQQATGTAVNLGNVDVDTVEQFLNAPMQSITVKDLRGAEQGWDLTATLKDSAFLGGTLGNSISNAEFRITGFDCSAVGANSTATSSEGAATQAGVAVGTSSFSFCSVDPAVAGPAGGGAGEYLVTGTFNLDVPAFQAVDTYTNTLITLLV
jgi:hypothetical protein